MFFMASTEIGPNNGMPLTPESLKIIDPELYDILSFLFPTREEFFKEMGWEADLK